jgi:DNA-binding beta-propeller fold protein YncE
LASGLSGADGVAVDGAGNVYVADYTGSSVSKWTAAKNTVTTLAAPGLTQPAGVAVDGSGNLYIADSANNEIDELPYVFVAPTFKLESLAAGNDALPVVVPASASLLAPFTPTSDQSWLAITGITNGVVSFAFSASASNRTGHLSVLGQTIPVVQGAASFSYSLATTARLEGPNAGSDSVILAGQPYFGLWTITANATWLHPSQANLSGVGSANVGFGFDANPGAPRSGTLTIAGQTLTVTQAGSTYVPAEQVTPLVSGLGQPNGVAVDGAGNVYIADFNNGALYKWMASGNTTAILATRLNNADGVAVDAAGNVYVADFGDNTIQKWTAATKTVTPLVFSGLNGPEAVAVDGVGNLYIADAGDNSIKEWTAANQELNVLVSSGLSAPAGVAVDIAGNVYIADLGNNAIKEWMAATGTLTTLVSSGLAGPVGVAVDVAGNVYIGDSANQAVKKWSAVSNSVTTLVSAGLNGPYGVAVDGMGNIYIADTGNKAVKELPYAFVDTTPQLESLAAGRGAFSVLPTNENLIAPFTPVSDQPWLNIYGDSDDVVSFSFPAATSNRVGFITVLGQAIGIVQGGPVYALGTSALLESPSAGSDSVVLSAIPNYGPWTVTANATWLHLSPANQSGTGSTNVIFSFDANSGVTRSGTLTIAGQTVAITQAGSAYVPADPVTTLVSGLGQPNGVAVDGAGNVYIADFNKDALYKWTAANNTMTPLVPSGLNNADGVAVDAAGNVYVADFGDNTIQKWTAANRKVTPLVISGLNQPEAVAVDGAGNLYIADAGDNSIKEWTAANQELTVLVSSGLSAPAGVAVDIAGNVYIADNGNDAIKEWMAASGTVTTLVSSGLAGPVGVAVDGSGNVYIGDSANQAVKKWIAASNSVTTLMSAGLSGSFGVAVDGMGNIYIADTGSASVKELPYAFVDTTPQPESLAAGNGAFSVLPTNENLFAPFSPVSDQSWLTIDGLSNGVVSFSFSAATSNRAGFIAVLGQAVPVAQGFVAYTYSLGTAALLEGPAAGSDSVVLAVNWFFGPWSNMANASWLHLSPANQSGAGSQDVVFSFDTNSGPTRSGTLTLAGQTVTVTQAGSTYVAAQPVTLLVSAGLSSPYGVAVDVAGDV